MSTDDFEAELYREYNWRFDEVRHLENLIRSQIAETTRNELRKSLVLVLYAHFEGFCLFALEHYLTAVNAANLRCADVIPAVLAGAWETLFNVMQHGDEKCEVFRTSLPDDKKLHRHWRRRHFIEEIDRFFRLPVSIAETVIDTESNLRPQVLQRNLFILGLDHTFVEKYASDINKLLSRRNAIAHGDQRRGIYEQEYKSLDAMVFEVCVNLINLLTDAYASRRFERFRLEYQV